MGSGHKSLVLNNVHIDHIWIEQVLTYKKLHFANVIIQGNIIYMIQNVLYIYVGL